MTSQICCRPSPLTRAHSEEMLAARQVQLRAWQASTLPEIEQHSACQEWACFRALVAVLA